MIKLKSLLLEKVETHDLVKNWKHDKAQNFASVLIDKYGEPDVKGGRLLMWRDLKLIDEENYNYKIKDVDKVFIIDENIEHSFPKPHIDFVYTMIKIPQIQAKGGQSTIEPDLVGKFAGVTGSIIIDGLKGEATARCGDLVANDVTLQFVLDSINGKIVPTRDEYANRINNISRN